MPALPRSPQQQAFCSAVLNTKAHLSLRAGAGTGKTTTMLMAVEDLKQAHPDLRILCVAFNKRIADELRARMPQDIECRTFNSLGLAIWRGQLGKQPRLNQQKTKELAQESGLKYTDFPDLFKALSLCKSHALKPSTDLETFNDLLDTYDVDTGDSEAPASVLRDMLKRSQAAAWAGLTDFDDQLYMPAIFGGPIPQYDVVFVDEAQDVNVVQRKLITRVAKKRLIIVGDPRQAIYGFRGSLADAMPELEHQYNMEVLPLNVTFRCPRAVVAEAQHWVSDYYAADSAPEGEVLRHQQIRAEEIPEGSTTILCRYNKPLVGLAFGLIHAGRPAKVLGRDLAVGLKKLVRTVGDYGEIRSFRTRLEDHYAKRASELEAKGQEGKLASLRDRVGCLGVLCSRLGHTKTTTDLLKEIERMFSSEAAPITLSSIHKAKGLEWDEVFWLDSWNVPSKHATSDWQIEQEYNCAYVAITRARKRLHYINLKGVTIG